MHSLRCTLFALSLALMAAGCGGAQKAPVITPAPDKKAAPEPDNKDAAPSPGDAASAPGGPALPASESDSDSDDAPAAEEEDADRSKSPEPETQGIDPCDPDGGW